MSYSDEVTEAKLNALEAKLNQEYAKAYDAMSIAYQHYLEGYDVVKGNKLVHIKGLQERIEAEELAYKAGKYTDAEWRQWQLTQISRGEGIKTLRDQAAKKMVDANKIAASYVNDETPGIYSLNANYQAYEIGQGLEGVSFDIIDEQTVKNMVTENGNYTEFKTVRTNPKRDYEWNSKLIQDAMTSGIIQGKGIDGLTDSFMSVMKRNRTAAIRNARTAFTSAQNGGRISGMMQAKNMGIKVQKKWLACHDDRVRFSHEMLDGQIRDVEKEFDNGLMFPGDRDGAPAEVYNCRCTLTYIYPDFDDDESKEIYKSNALDGETYNDFLYRMKRMKEEKQIDDSATEQEDS